MSQESAVARPRQIMQAVADSELARILNQPKPTFAALDKAISDAADSVDLTDALRAVANEALKNQLFLSPRLSRWQLGVSDKNVRGYWLRNSKETSTLTVTEDRVILSCPDPSGRVPFNYEVMNGLAASTLYKSIQDAQAIVQPRTANGLGMATDDNEEFFQSGDETYYESAGLDAALEETHSEPLVEDDAELIEEVTAVDPADEAEASELTEEVADKLSYTANTNQKNASTDGVQCPHCGNLNRDAYRGKCPQCPKPAVWVDEAAEEIRKLQGRLPEKGVTESFVTGRFKSLQGRILTIIDGSFSDKVQREAVKTQINKEFRAEITKVKGGE
jgi:hypothetical protein